VKLDRILDAVAWAIFVMMIFAIVVVFPVGVLVAVYLDDGWYGVAAFSAIIVVPSVLIWAVNRLDREH
jgi:ABC-type phosphate transport system permease subunit